MLLNRRGLLLGLASALAAPAIVRATSIMPVRTLRPYTIADIARFDDLENSLADPRLLLLRMEIYGEYIRESFTLPYEVLAPA